MNLTQEFNDAAGPSGDAVPVDGPSRPNQSGPTSVATQEQNYSSETGTNLAAQSITPEFQEAAAPPIEQQTNQTNGPEQVPSDPPKPASEQRNTAAPLPRPKVPTLAEAQAELQRLEMERATPDLNDNARPNRKVEQIVHTNIELKREQRTAALNALIEHLSHEAEYENDMRHNAGLELSL